MKNKLSYKKLLKWFLVEEWRMYMTLFGNRRLYLFPVVLALFGIVFGIAIPVFNVQLGTLILAYLALIVLFGVQTGSIGFEAEDAISNMLGESSRILYSSRYLPVGQKRLVGVFVLKDILFYSIFILLPVVIGIYAGILLSPFGLINIAVHNVILLYSTTIISFIFGITAGFMITTLSFNTRKQKLISKLTIGLILSVISIGLYVYTNNEMNIIFNSPIVVILSILTISIVFTIVGLIQFRNETNTVVNKEYRSVYSYVKSKIYNERYEIESTLVSKFVADIVRSAGGIWKVIFSTGLIAIAGVSMILIVSEFITTYESYPILFGTLIGIISYPIYTVIYRYDDIDSYQIYPITEYSVVKSKAILYIIMSVFLSTVYYVTLVLAYQYTITSFSIGYAVMIGLLVYQFALLMNFVEDKPIEFLFDGMLFSLYSVFTIIILVPVLVIGLYGSYLPIIWIYLVGLYSVIYTVVGLVLINRKLSQYKE